MLRKAIPAQLRRDLKFAGRSALGNTIPPITNLQNSASEFAAGRRAFSIAVRDRVVGACVSRRIGGWATVLSAVIMRV